jgi:hypothetical protein
MNISEDFYPCRFINASFHILKLGPKPKVTGQVNYQVKLYDVKLCNLVDKYQRFGIPGCFYLQGRKINVNSHPRYNINVRFSQ